MLVLPYSVSVGSEVVNFISEEALFIGSVNRIIY